MTEISIQNMHNLFDKTVNWGFAGIVYVQNLRNQQPLNSQSVSIQLYYTYLSGEEEDCSWEFMA